jgi:hypothetical protein
MKTLLIGAPCSPSEIISHEAIKMKRILITYGGGIGGGNKVYYTKKITKEQAINGSWDIETIDGKKISLMPRYIVEVEDTKVLKLVTNITEHKNYHKVVCTKSILTEYFDMSGFDNYEIVNKYIDRPKLIYQEEETK